MWVARLQTAINDVRNSEYFNNPTSPLPCLGAGNLKTYPALSSAGEPVTVTCAPDATSGGAGGLVQVNDSNKPSLWRCSPWARAERPA